VREHRAKIGTVFLIVFIDLVGFGIVIPILPLYAEQYEPSPVVFGLLMASFSIMQFVFAPVLGRLSDRVGRRPVLLVSLAAAAAGYLLFGFAHSLAVLFLSRIIPGIAGGNISTAHAVVADITGPEDRAKGMGLIGAAFGLGFILGPAIGGLAVAVRPWLPGVVAAAASATAFVLVLTLLPETLERGARQPAGRRAFDMRALCSALAQPLLGPALAMVFLTIFAFANFETTFAQLARLRFAFTTSTIAWLFAYAGVLGAVVQGGLIGHLARRFGEARLVIGGTLLSAFALAVLPALAGRGPLLGILAALALGQGVAHPALTSLVSRTAAAGEVGGVMGLQQGIASLARIAGPFWAEVAYGALGPGWPFWTAAATMLVACLLGAAALPARRPVAAAGR
jgi:multidrug resistance protein